MTPTIDKLAEALKDCVSGYQYIKDNHAGLYGVGYERCIENGTIALLAYEAEKEHRPAVEEVTVEELSRSYVDLVYNNRVDNDINKYSAISQDVLLGIAAKYPHGLRIVKGGE